MEFQYLKYFASVARLNSFARAAEACHVSQPALSVQIKKLEESLGTKLLNRNTQKVSLTKEGELLLPRVEQILAEIDTLAHSARALSDPWELPWTIGITPALAYSSLFVKLKKLQTKHASFQPSFREMTAPDLLTQLRNQTVDSIAIPSPGDFDAGDLLSLEIDRVPLVAVRPLGKTNKNLECISVHPGCGLRPALEQCALSMGSTVSSRHL
ncbi:LysR family transcriptional regulator, partial [bacterium]|nr:LysR family transcriptional regulator [bacterium]